MRQINLSLFYSLTYLMSRQIRVLLVVFLMAVSVHSQAADVADLLTDMQRYVDATQKEKARIAQSLFDGVLAEYNDSNRVSIDVNPEYFDAAVYYCAADYLYCQECYEQAMTYNLKAEQLMAESDSALFLSDCYSLTSCIYVRLSDFASATDYAARSLILCRKLDDDARISSALNTLAAIGIYAGQLPEAEKYILESLRIEEKLKRPAAYAIRLGMASEVFVREGKFDEGLKYAQEALRVEMEGGSEHKVPVRRSQLASALYSLGKIEEAREEALEAETALRAEENNTSLLTNSRLLSDIERKLGNTHQAIIYLKECITLSQHTGNLYQEAQANHQLAELYSNSEPAQAIPYWREYVRLKEQIYDDKMAMQLQSFNVRYQMAHQQRQLLQKDEQISLNHVLLIIGIILLIGCVLLAVFLARMVKRRDDDNRELMRTTEEKDEMLRRANDQIQQVQSAHQQMLDAEGRLGSVGEQEEVELTSRELQIVKLLSKGLLSKEVAEQLSISVRTVETHKNHIYRKLGISTTVELLRYGQQKGLI